MDPVEESLTNDIISSLQQAAMMPSPIAGKWSLM